jgi:hypothetical protein
MSANIMGKGDFVKGWWVPKEKRQKSKGKKMGRGKG